MIADPGRSAGGHRVYGSEHVERLRFIKRARELGFGLDDIRDLLDLSGDTLNGFQDANKITRTHLFKVREKIADLKRLESALENLSVLCGKNEKSCPILETLLD